MPFGTLIYLLFYIDIYISIDLYRYPRWLRLVRPQASGPLSADTVPGRAHQSTDAGKSRVSVPGHQAVTGPPDRQATGQGLLAGGGSLYSLLSRSGAGRTEVLTRAGRPSQKDFTLGGRLARGPGIRADNHKVQQAIGRGDPGPGALGHCKVPVTVSCLLQAAGMEQVTMHEERLLTRKVAS